MRILALVPGGISEQVLFFPTLETLKQNYPKAAIDVLVEPRAKAAYRVCQFVNEVLPFNYKDRNGLADYLNLFGVLRDREYDMVLNLEPGWPVGFLLWLNGIPLRVGYERGNSRFLTHTVPLKSEQYAAHSYHDLVGGLGLQGPCPSPQIKVLKADIDWAEAQQQRLGIGESGYILIHNGSGAYSLNQDIIKVYPSKNWLQIIKNIQEKQPDVSVILLQGPDDAAFVKEMQASAPYLTAIAPPDLGKLAAFIAGANLMLCTDSAPLQIAVAVGTYTIALFGPTEASKRLPADSDTYFGIQSPTQAMVDIAPVAVLEQIWRG